MAKQSSAGSPIRLLGVGNTRLQRPFSVLTLKSFLPGSAASNGFYPGSIPLTGVDQFPANSYLPPPMPMMGLPVPSYYSPFAPYSRRPAVPIIESNSCSRHRHRSRSYSRRHRILQ